ncbi:ribosome maturation factor RimM [Roseateles terrae]|jgi:16S rRNA processing protein RimM|uniref:Ribosome maturation factor RimM n=1 Tax=Roseateles terrae TaxID=431060 RepID=A0ABR6GQ14_9BURK|nr:ribosome maturation factor RimM [Roseateles terrae]MBB3194213.1 16S rRNA processing protein RimM [Roseateles terrae]OWQ88061.1 ribosome maturation factor RimM [Roseateles terrae]
MKTAPDLIDDQPTALPEDAIEVGRVLDAWGIKGWIKILSHSADADALFNARRWFLKPSERVNGAPPRPGASAASTAGTPVPPLLKILSVRDHGDGIVAQAEGVSDRSAAEALKGARIFVSRSTFPETDPDEFYWIDLIGLTVVNHEGQTLGEVTDLIDTGPHSVLRIVPPGLTPPVKPEQEILIPFVSAYVGDVDMAARRITVEWGLDY